jgi:ribosomal protein S12 methylthiotransferase
MATGAVPSARVYFHTLGCPKNDADSRALMRRLSAAGVRVVEDPADCTHLVVNTCGFIQDAKEESIEAILGVCTDHPDKKVLVMGCLVERYREDLMQGMPEVSGWFGVVGEDVICQLTQAVVGSEQGAGQAMTASVTAPKAHAYIKISDGCDESCTFCAIPGFKGNYESVSTAEIMREADACLTEGARELVLVGQDTTRWKSDGLDLRGLIDLLASDSRVKWIRVMYLQPARLMEPFLEFMAGHAKLCRYLDVPFQHSHEEILRSMGRRGDGASYLELLDKARKLMPGVVVRSTFIVGFPGETDGHFEDLMDFARKARFAYGGAFVYSPEEGTSAASLRPVVRRGVAQRRLNLLNEAILQSGESERSRILGAELEVMIDSLGGEEMGEEADAVGRIQGQAPEVDGVTYVKGTLDPGLVPGDMVKVRIVDVLGCDLVGEVCAS